MNQVPLKQRTFEDFAVGESFTLGSVQMKEQEMIGFATQFDPQRFHVDQFPLFKKTDTAGCLSPLL